MQIGTFHALCLSFLREQGEEVCLIDEREARELARSVTAEHGLKWKPDQFLAWVSREKSQEKSKEKSRENSPEELEKGVGVIPEADPEENFEGLSSKMVRMDEKSEGKEERERLDAAFLAYQAKLKERNRMDFDDLSGNCWSAWNGRRTPNGKSGIPICWWMNFRISIRSSTA